MKNIRKISEDSYWDDAYHKVENYLLALRIKNKRVLSGLVYRILERAAARLEKSPSKNPTTVAMEEAHEITAEWYRKVLGIEKNEHNIPVRGRLAMLLADVPNKWLKYFLVDGPWPDEFVKAMQDSFLLAGPDFQKSKMQRRNLDLTRPAIVIAETLKLIERRPVFRFLIYWILIVLLFVFVFYITR